MAAKKAPTKRREATDKEAKERFSKADKKRKMKPYRKPVTLSVKCVKALCELLDIEWDGKGF